MPLITVSLRASHTLDKPQLSRAIHHAVVAAGYPHDDLFQRFFTLDAEDFHLDPTYPDLVKPRSHNVLFIEVKVSSGTPDERKQRLLQSLVTELEKIGLDSNDLMLFFSELDRLNSSFGGGRKAAPLPPAQ